MSGYSKEQFKACVNRVYEKNTGMGLDGYEVNGYSATFKFKSRRGHENWTADYNFNGVNTEGTYYSKYDRQSAKPSIIGYELQKEILKLL